MSNPRKPGTSGSFEEVLRDALADADLASALDAARRARLSDPGGEGPRRAVESLELLLAQTWYESDEAGSTPFTRAAEALSTCDLDRALAEYASSPAVTLDLDRAQHLARSVRLVIALRDGTPLPPRETSASIEVAPIQHEMPTRVAGARELPLDLLTEEDEVGSDPLHATLTDHTGELSEEDYELYDDVSRSTVAGLRERTRVAKEGELPLEELRRQLALEEAESSGPFHPEADGVDGLLDELELEVEVEPSVVITPSKTFRRPAREALEAREEILTPPIYLSEPPSAPAEDSRVDRPSDPPIPTREQLAEVHAPVNTRELAIPEARRRDDPTLPSRRELPPAEGAGEPTWSERKTGPVADVTSSWAGVPVYETEPATFEPGDVTLDEDRWDAPSTAPMVSREREAESLVARGELEPALRIYEELAARAPEETRLWRRIKAIAWMLKRGAEPTKT
ncbi:MAG: hypothetical protein AB7S26_37780 [Sandaracinaceae bacterium]